MSSSQKIKVLYIVSTLKRAGPTNQLFNIISNLDSKRFHAEVLTLSKESNDSLESLFKNRGIKIDSLGLGRLAGLLTMKRHLGEKIKSYSPQVIHTQGIRSDFYASKFKSDKIKTVATIRCNPYEDYVMLYGKFRGKLMAKNHLNTLQKLDSVVAVSNSIRCAIMPYGVMPQVIQNGVDTKRFFSTSTESRIELRKLLGLPLDKKVLISVGHLSIRKDPLTVLRAFKASLTNRDYHLLFVGDGALRPQCEQASAGHQNIQFVGRVNNVDEYLRAADVFISASHSEGLPNSVLESLACGTPPILSNIPQHMELFEDEEIRCPFFGIGDETALANIIDQLPTYTIQNLPTTQLIDNKFNAIKMSQKYQSLYLHFFH